MTSLGNETAARAVSVATTAEDLVVRLSDGRTITVPLSWYPRLFNATPEQRERYRVIGDGEYIHWPEIDEDLTVAGLLRGVRAPQKRAG